MNKIEFSEINGVVKIGGGSQAHIYRIPAGSLYKTDVALKKYKNKHLSGNEAAIESYLDELISIKKRMSNDYKTILDQYTTWPVKIVYEKGKACGYIMHLIPDMFFTNMNIPLSGTEKMLSSLDFILHGSKFRADNNLPRISDKGMARVIYFLLKVLAILHEENIILGDLSPSNVLVYIDSQNQSNNRVLFIDTDSFRILGNTHPLKQLHTPEWVPPECQPAQDELNRLPDNADSHIKASLEIMKNMQNKATDVYKICLAITRLYHEGEHPSSIIFSTSAQEKLAKKIDVEFSDKVVSGLSDNPKQRPTINMLYECLINALSRKVNK